MKRLHFLNIFSFSQSFEESLFKKWVVCSVDPGVSNFNKALISVEIMLVFKDLPPS